MEMILNPTCKIIKVNDECLLYRGTDKKYFLIDLLTYDLLKNSKKYYPESMDAVRWDYLIENQIIVPPDYSGKTIKSHMKFGLTRIDLFSFNINQFMDKTSRLTHFMTKLVNRYYGYFCILMLLISLYTLFNIFGNLSDIQCQIDNSILTFKNALFVYLGTFVLTTWHELGHAYSCKKYTGSVGHCGIMLYFLFPVFYTDVTVMRASPKNEKMIIILSGILNQISASGIISVVIAYYTVITNTMPWVLIYLFLVNIILIFSNINPFYKYDGYWLISVLIGKEYLYRSAIHELISIIYVRKNKVNWLLASYGFGMAICYIVSWIIVILFVYQVTSRFSKGYGLVLSLLMCVLVIIELTLQVKRVRLNKE